MCGTDLIASRELHYGLCDECRTQLKEDAPSCCKICGKPLISEIDTCLSCKNTEEHSYDKMWVLFPYTGKYRNLLGAYKFGKNLALANYFTRLIIHLVEKNSELTNAQIVPVPPRPGKKKSKGWDQVDYLVKRLQKTSPEKITVNRCLKRKKSKVQKSLNRNDRLNNLQGKIFQCATAPKIALLIDDVVTTGSTLQVCSGVLKKAGSEKVYCVSLFYD